MKLTLKQLIAYSKMDMEKWPADIVPIEKYADKIFLTEHLRPMRKRVADDVKRDAVLSRKKAPSLPPIYIVKPIENWRELLQEMAADTNPSPQVQQNYLDAMYYLDHITNTYRFSEFKGRSAILMGEEAYKKYSSEQRIGILYHEYGHEFANVTAEDLVTSKVAPDLDTAKKTLQHVNECRADLFVPPEHRSDLISALKISIDDEASLTAVRTIRRNYNNTRPTPKPSTHPETDAREAASRSLVAVAGLSAMKKLPITDQCTIAAPSAAASNGWRTEIRAVGE